MGGGQLEAAASDLDGDPDERSVRQDEAPIRANSVGGKDLVDLVEESVGALI
jgi:hypothetical protein